MIHYYQPFLLPFLRLKKHSLARGLERRYYHSFEDGLWDLLKRLKVPKQGLILLPDFYCMEVVENIQNHGYTTAFYPLNEHFQIDAKTLSGILKKRNVSVVVVFHAAGISSQIVNDSHWWKELPNDCIVIEDMVHRLVNPSEVRLKRVNHYWIDSLRKVSPLPGSFLYGRKLWQQSRDALRLDRYILMTWWWYACFTVCFAISQLVNSSSLAAFAHNYFLKRHDDIVGDHHDAHAGIPLLGLINRFFDFEKVTRLKKKQVQYYELQLQHVFEQSCLFYRVEIDRQDFGSLHVYPLGMKSKPEEKLEHFLQERGMAIWFKFPDCPWSQDKSVLYLPLGFHISDRDIAKISLALWEYEQLG